VNGEDAAADSAFPGQSDIEGKLTCLVIKAA
jgi:hypothetical protein